MSLGTSAHGRGSVPFMHSTRQVSSPKLVMQLSSISREECRQDGSTVRSSGASLAQNGIEKSHMQYIATPFLPQPNWQATSENGNCANNTELKTPGSHHFPTRTIIRRRRRQQRTAKARYPTEEGQAVNGMSWSEMKALAAEEEAFQAKAIAKSLLELFAAGGCARELAISRFRDLAFLDKPSSRATQLALTESSAKDARELAWGLRGHISAATESMYANFVVQKIVEVLPTKASSFVAEELLGIGCKIARHRFGCRVICRLLEHSVGKEDATAKLLDEILDKAATLCRHGYGSFVAEHFLEFGSQEHRQRLVEVLRADLTAMAIDKIGRRVLEQALRFASPNDKSALASDLLASPEQFQLMAQDPHASRVLQCLADMPESQQRVAELLKASADHLRNRRLGRQTLELLENVLSS